MLVNLLLLSVQPLDVSTVMQKETFTEIHHLALLECTVKAYPPIIDDCVDVFFRNSTLPANRVHVQTGNIIDETLIEIEFDPVTASDFGLYKVVINNGVGGDKVINLTLNDTEQGGSHMLNRCNDFICSKDKPKYIYNVNRHTHNANFALR